ncbi:hypothetical protein [Aurantiacibacter odishensis]|uniref:hypothetical protein n=1 Tax=Aurantiacibacter odishensis TaxID=1155476 RepID=UPI0013C4D23A|nr:hypothetical protein [Aurantiacibacter odishensis]
MAGRLMFILVAVAVIFGLSVWVDNRIAAGAGALLLLGALIYGYVQTKRTTPAQDVRSERGARKLREEIVEDEERRGTR